MRSSLPRGTQPCPPGKNRQHIGIRRARGYGRRLCWRGCCGLGVRDLEWPSSAVGAGEVARRVCGGCGGLARCWWAGSFVFGIWVVWVWRELQTSLDLRAPCPGCRCPRRARGSMTRPCAGCGGGRTSVHQRQKCQCPNNAKRRRSQDRTRLVV